MALGTQDKAKARRLREHAASLAAAFLACTDLGDRADRLGPDLAQAVSELARLEGWPSTSSFTASR